MFKSATIWRNAVLFCSASAVLAVITPALNAGELAVEFTGTSNPGNGWSHGYVDDFAGDSLMGRFNTGDQAGQRWTSDPTGSAAYPPNDLLLVTRGTGGHTNDHWGDTGGIDWVTGQMYHAWGGSTRGDDESTGTDPLPNGADTIFSTFTVSAAGVYSISANWNLQTIGNAANVNVLINGSSVFAHSIDHTNNGVSNLASFTTSAALNIGDTVSFRTSPNDTNGGAAALNATVVIPSLSFQINRQTGLITVSNVGTSTIGLAGYSLTSPSGAFDPSHWTSLASTPSNGWLEFSSTEYELSEGSLGTRQIAPGGSLSLGNVWLSNPVEDLHLDVVLADNSTRTFSPQFSGTAIPIGDLNGNGSVTPADWPLFKAGQRANLTGLSPAAAYKKGDLDGDLDNDLNDFRQFKTAYEAVNGTFNLSSIPEPASMLLGLFGAAAVYAVRKRRLACMFASSACFRALAIATVSVVLTASSAWAGNLADEFTGTSNPGNGWSHGYVDDFAGDSLMGRFNTGDQAGQRWTSDPTGSAAYPPNDLLLVTRGTGGHTNDHWGDTGGIDWVTGQMYHAWGGSTRGDDESTGTDPLPNGADTIFSTFTVSTAGTYNINASWDLQTIGNAAGVNVLINGSSVFAHSIDHTNNGVSNLASFTTSAALNIGDTVSFRTSPNDTNGGAAALNASVMNALPQTLTLRVDKTTGQLQIANLSGNPITFDSYEILGPAGSLVSAGFNGVRGDLPAFPAGNGSGNGWEIGAGSSNEALVETYLTGSSTLQNGQVLQLGAAYNAAVDSEALTFQIGLANGSQLEGVFDYNANLGAPGDFDGNEKVDGADFLRWQRTDKTPAGLANWKANYGVGAVAAASSTAIAAVPEPAAAVLCCAAMAFCALIARRRRADRQFGRVAMIAALTAFSTTPAALASRTADRLYRFGEDPNESGQVNNTLGQNSVLAGMLIDSEYDDFVNFTDLQTLAVNGNPVYVAPNNPKTPGSTLAASFDGNGEFLVADRLGKPENTVSSAFHDYSGIYDPGYQFWVKPSSNAALQSVVMDSNQFGVQISSGGHWSLRYADTDVESTVAVAPGTWHHVELVRTPLAYSAQSVAVLYVDGYAAAARAGDYNGDDNARLTIGAATGDPNDTDPNNQPGSGEFFTGVIDELEMFVLGRSLDTATPYGTFSFATDNAFAESALATMTQGDLTGNGTVTGNGTGSVLTDDVSAFVANFGYRHLVNGVVVPDLASRSKGDFDFDGAVTIFDWAILRAHHSGSPLGPLSDYVAAAVPEPDTLLLIAAGGFLIAARRQLAR